MAGTQLDTTGVIVACSQCGRNNRLRYEALAKQTRCAHCKSALAAPAVPIEATQSAAFTAAAQQSVLPLLVDFWAPWCGPCRMVAPELEKVARNNAGRYLVVKVNTDVLTDLAAQFRIQSIPTMALVHGGREIARVSGARDAHAIEAWVSETLAGDTRRAS